MQNDLAVIIPAYNEESSISEVIVNSLNYGDPIVVDDGSVDQTKHIAIKKGAKLLSHKKNFGYDEALYTGLKYASFKGYKFAITIDADGQHDPKLIETFSFELTNGADLVLGFRDKKQRISEKFFSFVSNFLWKVKDPLCGMKGYRLSLLEKYPPFKTFNSYGSEFAIKLVKKKICYSQVFLKISKRLDDSRMGGIFFTNFKILSILLIMLTKVKIF